MTFDYIVTIAQGGDVTAHKIIWPATDEAMRVGDRAAYSGVAVAPGHRTAKGVPLWTSDHVVTVTQGDHEACSTNGDHAANRIHGVTAGEAIRGGNGSTDPRIAVTPGHRAPLAIPIRICNHVVATAESSDNGEEAHPIVGMAADEGTNECTT